MDNQNSKQKRIGNVATLDLREATEASLANIKSIGNVALILQSPENAELVTRLAIGNVAAVIEAPAGAKIITGQQIFNRHSFKSTAEPLNLILSGQLVIEPDLPEEELARGLDQLIVAGQVLCPDHLMGILQSKLSYSSGQILTYRQGAKMIIGHLELSESYLRALGDATALVVVGKVTAPELLPNDLIEQKIQKMNVIGRVVCREENAPALLARLDDQGGLAHNTIIPAGFHWLERPLALEADLLESLPGQKLYCAGMVRIGEDVTAEALDQALEKLIVKDVLIAPAALKGALARKCNLLETRAIFYTGELWLVETEFTLLAARFNYLEGKATLVIHGELTVAPEVEPRLLAERLEKVHNFGEIICSREQMAALQSRLGINEGEFVDIEAGEEESGNIGNIAYLKL